MSENEQTPTNLEEQLVVFELANESYAVDIGVVSTIVRAQVSTRIPRSPDYVEGVINLRGRIVPTINLRRRLGFPDIQSDRTSRIVIIEAENELIGLMVDSVTETVRLPAEAVEPSCGLDCVRGIGKVDDRLIILLDLEKLLSSSPSEVPTQPREAA